MNAVPPPVELKPNMLVMSSDGDEIGRIKEIGATCFKVDRPMQIDVWLDKGSVNSTEFGAAQLRLPKEAFNQLNTLGTLHSGIHLHE